MELFAPYDSPDLSPDGSGRAALQILHESYNRAREVGLDPWEFAVGIDELSAAGVGHSELRWFVVRGVMAHAQELPDPEAHTRRFRTLANLCFPDHTCFVLTAEGLRLAGQVADDPAPGPDGRVPIWDPERRELRWAGVILKRFRSPAENQERILSAFQEEDWPARVDDPLPPNDSRDSQARLRDAIRRLNDQHTRRTIRFSGDGTGTGVCWRPMASDVTRRG